MRSDRPTQLGPGRSYDRRQMSSEDRLRKSEDATTRALDSGSQIAPETTSNDASAIWKLVSGGLAEVLPAHIHKLWIEPLQPAGIQGSKLLLAGPEKVRSWVERRYLDQLLRTLRAAFPEITSVAFVKSSGPITSNNGAAAAVELNPDYSFESFVIGPGNRLAHGAALHVAEAPGEVLNPLFIYGPPGLGKTHLLVAMARYIGATRPAMRVHYTTAEAFTKEFVTAMRTQGGDAFQERYRDYGALLIDDVQFLAGKPKTEEEFFHTFNALYEGGSQIVLSSDREPTAHEGLAERLRDRFAWGMTAELERPDLPTRLAVLKKLGRRISGSDVDPEVLDEIANRSDTNLRQLEGALTRVTAFASLIGRTPDRRLAVEVTGSTDPGSELPAIRASRREVTIEQIKDAVCECLHLRRADLTSSRRTAEVVRGRHLAIYLARQRTNHSLVEIAGAFKRDHSSVVHAVASIKRKLEPGSEMSIAVEKVNQLLDRTGSID